MSAVVVVGLTTCSVAACSTGGSQPPVASTSATVVTTAGTTTASLTPATRDLVMPDLRGLTSWADAEGVMRQIGWTGQVVKGPDDPNSDYPAHDVADQDPAAGQRIDAGALITLRFSSTAP
jgi:beta-lactam-binding protein with PASTA domain